MTQSGDSNLAGDEAQTTSRNFTTPFLSSFYYTELLLNNSTRLSHFQPVAQNTAEFGPTHSDVVTYNVPGPFSIRPNFTIYNAQFGVGTLSVSGLISPPTILTHEVIFSTRGPSAFNLISAKG